MLALKLRELCTFPIRPKGPAVLKVYTRDTRSFSTKDCSQQTRLVPNSLLPPQPLCLLKRTLGAAPWSPSSSTVVHFLSIHSPFNPSHPPLPTTQSTTTPPPTLTPAIRPSRYHYSYRRLVRGEEGGTNKSANGRDELSTGMGYDQRSAHSGLPSGDCELCEPHKGPDSYH